MLIALIALAIIFQLVLFKSSEKVKNPYNFTLACVATVANVAVAVAMYFVYNLGAVKQITQAVSPLLIFTNISILISIIIIDYKYYEIPNEHNLALFISGIMFVIKNYTAWKTLLLGGAICLAIYVVLFILVKGNIGFGDVKLATSLSLTLGMGYLSKFFMLSFLSGAVISIILMLFKIKKRTDKIAFGPYIALAYAIIFLTF